MPSKKSTPQSAAAVTPATPVVEPVVEVQPSKEVVTEVEVDRYASILDKLQSFASELKEVIATVKVLQKEHTKLKNQKSGRKAKAVAKDGEKRAPSGFAKPTLLSDELCEFLGQPKGTSLARTEVTRIINKYVKDQNLQDENDKRQINPDAKLKSILSTKGPDDKVTYFNLQSFIKHHFVKA